MGSQEKGGDFTHRGGREQANTEYDRNAFSGGYGYQRAGHEFGLNYSNTDLGHTGTPALPMDIAYVRGGAVGHASRLGFRGWRFT